jgi:hypothetical protein
MLGEQEEISLTKWRALLTRELTITLEESPEIHKDGANKRHQHYVERCAEQYRKIINRITAAIGKRRAD